MASGEPVVPVSVLRDAARRLVERTSLRTAAGEIGISHSGLRTFLKGTEPYGPTLAKLRAWYAQTEEGRAMTPERARVVLASILEGIPPERREEAERSLRETVERIYRDAGAEPPDWLKREP